MEEVSLVEYSDYRSYLRAYYVRQKKSNPSFSYRSFALRAKLSSPNYLKLVIDGDRRITDKTLPNFIRGLRLAKLEADYFRNLVLYQESEDAEAKAAHLRELARLRSRWGKEEKNIEHDRLEFLRGWHHWVIRELVLLEDFSPDPEWIAKRLRHKITPKEAKESLAVLERLEFIQIKDGKYIQSEPLSTVGDEVSSLILWNLYCQFFQFAIQSILNDKREDREFGGVTLAISKSRLPEIKALIREFRLEFNRRFSEPEGNDAVYNLGLAFFPLTKEGSL